MLPWLGSGGLLSLGGFLPLLLRGAPCGCTLTQDGVQHPAGQLPPEGGGGRAAGCGGHSEPLHAPPPKLAGTGAWARSALCPVTQLAPRCHAQRLPSASLGDCSVFMFHPGLPAAEPASSLLGWRAVKGSWDQVLLCCASSLPGRCDSCSQGSFSPSAAALLEC